MVMKFVFPVFLRCLCLVMILQLLSGCVDQLKPTLDRTTSAFDDAIRRIEQQSSSWQSVLRELEGKLTAAAQSTLRSEVQNTLLRAESAAGTKVRCIVDFMGDRVLEDLRQIREQIKAALTGGRVQLQRQMKLCQVVPVAVDMSLEPGRRNLITFDGYNFDTLSGVKVTLNERQGGGILAIDVTQYLTRQTHYHMILNLGENGVRLTANSQTIVLTFPGGDSTIPVIQPSLPKCQTREDSVDIGNRTYRPPWDPTTGDREFFGKVDINVNVSVAMENNRLIGRIYMKAEQYDDDHTRAEGTDEFDAAYVVPQGWRFASITTPAVDTFSYRDKTWEDDIFDRGNGLVRQYVFVGDTATDEAGTKTQVTVDFNPVRVQILLAIGTGEACVCHLESLLGLRQAYISQHLMALRKQEIITARRDGKYIFYRLVEPEVLDIIRKVGRMAGVSEEALVIQDHSNCECPKCSMKQTVVSANLPVSGQA